jgi:hypothetical protein
MARPAWFSHENQRFDQQTARRRKSTYIGPEKLTLLPEQAKNFWPPAASINFTLAKITQKWSNERKYKISRLKASSFELFFAQWCFEGIFSNKICHNSGKNLSGVGCEQNCGSCGRVRVHFR